MLLICVGILVDSGSKMPWRSMWFMAGFAVILLPFMFGCSASPTKPIVEYKTVSVPTYIRAPIPPEYTVDRIVTEPQPACRLIGPPALVVFCQNQVAELIDSYRAALRQSNLDKAALRSLDKQPE